MRVNIMIYNFDNRNDFNSTCYAPLCPSDLTDLLYYQMVAAINNSGSGTGGSGTSGSGTGTGTGGSGTSAVSNVVLFKYTLTSDDMNNKQFQLPYTVSDTNDVFFISPVGSSFISGVDFDIVNNKYINWMNYSATAEILTVGTPVIVVYYKT
jgi:hypothetical protein